MFKGSGRGSTVVTHEVRYGNVFEGSGRGPGVVTHEINNVFNGSGVVNHEFYKGTICPGPKNGVETSRNVGFKAHAVTSSMKPRITCYTCGEFGHVSPVCRNNDSSE